MTVGALLHLDGDDASTVIIDYSAAPGKTFTAYGNAQLDTAPALLSGSTAWLSLDGTNSYIQSEVHADFNQSGNWTIEGWIRPSATLQEGSIFYFGSLASDTNKVILYVTSNGALNLYINQGGSWWGPLQSSTGVVVANGVPKHVAVCKSGSTWYIQYDGVRRNYQTMFATSANIGQLTIGSGRNAAGSTIYFKGHIDEVRFTEDTALYTGSTYSTLVRFPDVITFDTVIANTELTISGPSSSVVAQTELTIQQSSYIVSADTKLTVSNAAYQVDAETSLTIYAKGTPVALTTLAILDTVTASDLITSGDAMKWSIQCFIDGVDVSSRVTGTASIDAEEGAARVADITIIPSSGVVDPLDYVGLEIIINFVRVVSGVDVPLRLFTGRIDTPTYDIASTRLSFSCVDDLQNRVSLLDRDDIDTLTGGKYSEFVQGDILDNWDYAKALMSTVSGSLDADANGALRVTQWSGLPLFATYDESILIYKQSALSLPQRSTLINQVSIDYAYRYSRLRQRFGTIGFSATRNEMDRAGYTYPVQQDIESAAQATGWTQTLGVYYHPPATIPHPSGGYVRTRDGAIDMAIVYMTQRHGQTVSEVYEITVSAPESISQNGVLPYSFRGAAEDKFNYQVWEDDLSISPTFTSNGEIDYAPNVTRTDSDFAISTLLDIANAKILSTHRGATVTNATPLDTRIDLDKRIRVLTTDMDCEGKVSRVVHSMNVDNGIALTEFTLSMFGAGGAGIITPDTLAPPDPPPEQVETQSWGAELPDLRVYVFGQSPYSENAMGLLINPLESYSVENVPDGLGGYETISYDNPYWQEGTYPVTGFRVRMPGVNSADRNPVENTVVESFDIVIPSDTISFTVP